ncbi:MAG: hypothetical protein VKJ46_01435 [Leptolyngbyaceae bacterium]|nr:hypothetical protein [Leptolyngbyaceae bacterium]
MSSSTNKSSSSLSLFSVQNIVLAELGWAFLALLFFLFFSVPPAGGQPAWYGIGTLIFELGAYLGAAILCFRNWKSPQIVSGRNVWLGIGMGTFSYFLGSVIFGYWEIGLGQDPAVSPGDFFFVLAYLFLGWGMFSAVFSRKLSLEIWQWAIVAGIGLVGGLLAWWISTVPPNVPQQSLLMPAAIAQSAPPSKPAKAPVKPPAKASPKSKAPAATPKVTPKPVAPKPVVSPAVPSASPAAPIASPTAPASPAAIEPASTAPEWVTSLEALLAPLEGPIGLFYVISDVALLILATILLLAFWGGRFSLSWRMIAAAAFSLYIADMWFKYASRSPDYESGSLPEVFWVFSGVLFGLGAVLEYSLSTRSRRAGGRRRG